MFECWMSHSKSEPLLFHTPAAMVLWMIGLGLGDEGDISVKGLKAVQRSLGFGTRESSGWFKQGLDGSEHFTHDLWRECLEDLTRSDRSNSQCVRAAFSFAILQTCFGMQMHANACKFLKRWATPKYWPYEMAAKHPFCWPQQGVLTFTWKRGLAAHWTW